MKKFYVIMLIVITALVILNIEVSGVGAATTLSQQQKISVLIKDAHTKSCNQLNSDARKFKKFQTIDSSMKTEWVEMISDFEVASIACNEHDQFVKFVKKAQYRAHELIVQFANSDENHLEVTH